RTLLSEIQAKYDVWKRDSLAVVALDRAACDRKVQLFETYKDFIDQAKYAQAFDPRGVLHASVLEEFMFYLFKDLVTRYGEKAVIGKARVYESLTFSPASFEEMMRSLPVSLRLKDEDFVIGREVELQVSSASQGMG